jgi:hypothetical protein
MAEVPGPGARSPGPWASDLRVPNRTNADPAAGAPVGG